MELLRRQLLSPRYIQHSARVLFILAEANESRRGEILKAIFDLERKQITSQALRRVYDYVYDIS
jgi:malate synthase